MRNGGQLVVECLEGLGARRAFGVPGESYLAVLDALHGSRIDFVNCRQEGGAAFAAAAHGKLTGEPGICMVTRGPGATNASIGVHTAMQDSAPMILLVGQIATDMREREAFQEVDYRAVFGTMSKWVTEIDHVDRIPELLSRAWTVATSGRPGPVVIALPEDTLSATSAAAPVVGPIAIHPAEPAPAAIEEARRLLAGAERPLIVLGGAPWDRAASEALMRFAEGSDVPVITSFRYQDQVDHGSDVFCGDAGVGMAGSVRGLLRDADVILALGTRFGENMTDGYELLSVPDPVQKIVHVHAGDGEIGKVYRPALGVTASPERFALALGAPVQGSWSDWRRAARKAHLSFIDKAPAQPGPVDMVAVCAHLRERLAGQPLVLTNGAGNFTVWPTRFFRFTPGMRLLAPQSGAMGYGLPAAIAAKLERPGAPVICFAGDGDIQMTLQELATARQAGAGIIVIVVNNGTYGTIRAHQEREFPARVSGTDLVNPDFASIARACGLHGERVESTGAFAAAFERAMASPTGALLELTVDKEALTPYRTLTQIREGS
ncbi:thiamine pyrophosphate TPP-binding domain-containing protein [Salipiger pallidus]|uniref:Thiamine pyrophosphate TPP-binding domain-containing protein n=1 Tax=Salipiger pallidus TaxID=1775170 RepID=A0A8J2ZH88_9RHOB|nr:thiamine pyrophosphate-dependent enzyme [Salipiger pallidus]GGG63328.1 thiamine pyrophosphate TPP-binding domain-containing protein [Salipiger pallidus]